MLIPAEPVVAAEPAPVEGAVVEPVAAPAATALVRPEGLPDSYWDEAAGVKPEAYARLAELEAAATARAEGVPADGNYVFELPADMVGADGKPLQVDATDPLAVALKEIAAEHQLPAAAVNKLVAQYARAELDASAALAAEQAAEVAKLGPAAKTRIDAFQAALTKHAGPKAQALIDAIGTAEAVEAVETLLKGITGPAVAAPVAVAEVKKFEGLHGAELLSAARAAQAR